jgi:hypothetical protein
MLDQTQSLLSLVVAPEIEDSIVDWLMQRPEVVGFSSYPISGHGSSLHAMTTLEQVAGRQRKIMFQIGLPEADVQRLLDGLWGNFKGADLHYWQVPLQAHGNLAAPG